MTGLAPLVPFLKVPDEGSPYLEGLRCRECDAVFLDTRRHCAACSARDALETTRLANHGRLHT